MVLCATLYSQSQPIWLVVFLPLPGFGLNVLVYLISNDIQFDYVIFWHLMIVLLAGDMLQYLNSMATLGKHCTSQGYYLVFSMENAHDCNVINCDA